MTNFFPITTNYTVPASGDLTVGDSVFSGDNLVSLFNVNGILYTREYNGTSGIPIGKLITVGLASNPTVTSSAPNYIFSWNDQYGNAWVSGKWEEIVLPSTQITSNASLNTRTSTIFSDKSTALIAYADGMSNNINAIYLDIKDGKVSPGKVEQINSNQTYKNAKVSVAKVSEGRDNGLLPYKIP